MLQSRCDSLREREDCPSDFREVTLIKVYPITNFELFGSPRQACYDSSTLLKIHRWLERYLYTFDLNGSIKAEPLNYQSVTVRLVPLSDDARSVAKAVTCSVYRSYFFQLFIGDGEIRLRKKPVKLVRQRLPMELRYLLVS